MTDTNFDLIVIGGGPGGYVAAIRASQLGMSVALVVTGVLTLGIGVYPEPFLALAQSSLIR